MDLKLKGKRAVVLGGTRGIGRAIAETLASEGADVAICARNRDQIEEAVAAVTSDGTINPTTVSLNFNPTMPTMKINPTAFLLRLPY